MWKEETNRVKRGTVTCQPRPLPRRIIWIIVAPGPASSLRAYTECIVELRPRLAVTWDGAGQ